MSVPKIGIVGAGLVGRLLALEFLQQGWHVSLFDQDSCRGETSCGWVAAGMVAPYTELESSELFMLHLGLASVARWPKILTNLFEPVSFNFLGTLLVAHPQDTGELNRFRTI